MLDETTWEGHANRRWSWFVLRSPSPTPTTHGGRLRRACLCRTWRLCTSSASVYQQLYCCYCVWIIGVLGNMRKCAMAHGEFRTASRASLSFHHRFWDSNLDDQTCMASELTIWAISLAFLSYLKPNEGKELEKTTQKASPQSSESGRCRHDYLILSTEGWDHGWPAALRQYHWRMAVWGEVEILVAVRPRNIFSLSFFNFFIFFRFWMFILAADECLKKRLTLNWTGRL